VIEIEGLTVTFGGVRALDALTLDLDGDVVGIIGPNGAGKTTLLNVMSGFVPAVSGRVHVDGVDILALSPARRARWGLRRTFQTELLADDLSVFDNVLVAAENTGAGARAAAHDALHLVGLEDEADEPAQRLDSFRRRLVEVARAAVATPRLMLLDEPGGGLAPDESARLRELILSLPASTEARVVVVDHDVDLIADTCVQTACLDFGELIAVGPTRDVLDDARVRAAYLGIDEGQGVA
jgi:branched-chain amino acid transport system ATP-binding protein